MKPGFKTTEFILNGAALILLALVSLDIVSITQVTEVMSGVPGGTDFINSLMSQIEKLVALAGAIGLPVHYIRKRTELKKQEVAADIKREQINAKPS